MQDKNSSTKIYQIADTEINQNHQDPYLKNIHQDGITGLSTH